MKAKLQIYLQSVAALLALTLLFSLLFAALYYFTVISASTFHILNWIGGAIAYGAGGLLLGLQIKKKALFSALGMLVLLLVPAFLLCDFSMMAAIEILSKGFVFLAACMLMYTRTMAKA